MSDGRRCHLSQWEYANFSLGKFPNFEIEFEQAFNISGTHKTGSVLDLETSAHPPDEEDAGGGTES
jgi:hypothetical protein